MNKENSTKKVIIEITTDGISVSCPVGVDPVLVVEILRHFADLLRPLRDQLKHLEDDC